MSTEPENKTNDQFLGLEKRNVKLGLYGFLFVLLATMLGLKPFLPTAIYHNFATIYDYQFFSNRVVRGAPGAPLERSSTTLKEPNANTAQMLKDLKTTALVVLQDGKIAYERYDLDGGVDVLSGSFSMAKSIVGLLTGFALQDHKIKSLDEPISHYIPEWEDRDEGKITIKQLLTMTSGLNWDESYWNPLSITTEAYYGNDLLKTALKQRIAHDPGTLFSYQSGTTQLLGIVVSRAVNRTLGQYASEKLWMPLQAEKDALWSIDHEEGMEKGYCCFNARARDFARIGELVRLQGKWNGQALLNPEYIQAMTHPHGILNTDGKPTDYYGYQWWVMKTAQGEIPYARGILGQYIIVIPQKNEVLVRLGKATGERFDHHPVEVRALVDWALTQ